MAAKRTPLYDTHKQLGARIVEFAGWDMPVQYKAGIIKEHKCVRSAAGMFDVSHMGEVFIRGQGAEAAIQRLVTNDVTRLEDSAAQYTVMCYESGGIVDDCIVYRRAAGDYFIVINAGNIEKDVAWIREVIGDRADVDDRSDETGLLAVQGPRAVGIVDRLTEHDMADVGRFRMASCEVAGVPVTAARTGYTGEDGFELLCSADRVVELWNALLSEGEADGLSPIGLGARDTLRLEARLCLYGSDIDENTTPYEAGLGWVVKLDSGDFIGKAALKKQKTDGVDKKLIGFTIAGRGIARHGYAIHSGKERVGEVTSGTTGVWVGGAIGMGYVPTALSKPGTELTIDCRGKDVAAIVHKGPFYKRG